MSHLTQPTLSPLDEAELEAEYLAALRQRFKNEINRLTSGAMSGMLGELPDADLLGFPLTYLYGLHWLREWVPNRHRKRLLEPFRKGKQGFLIDLLLSSEDSDQFARGYIDQLSRQSDETWLQGRQLRELLQTHGEEGLARRIVECWNELGLFRQSAADAYGALGRMERTRYRGMLGPEDRERLDLVDRLPDRQPSSNRFDKLGIIPAMGCPQTCRHCMFIWRPPMRNTPDPEPILEAVDGLTTSVLFTGGDLTNHLGSFTRAIRSMRRIRTFAILLNGDFASDPATTENVLEDMASAVRERPGEWPAAEVLLQISFDELHQEIIEDRSGTIRERIPIAKIANIVERAPRFPEIQLCLVHKQNALNFSMDVFRKGVFGRLARELGRRGHRLRILASSPSPRLKRRPQTPQGPAAPVLKDASFILERHPERPILLTSSTIDRYGRAVLLEEGESVREPDLLAQVLHGKSPAGEEFDTDLMFWFNGWVTLFSAVHLCLGDFYRDGLDTILARRRKDPLTAALRELDLRLLELYKEKRADLETRISTATSPHQLFHGITEEPEIRLHMTRRLLEGA